MTQKIIAIVPAAGVGQRAGAGPAETSGRALPKQYRLIRGEPMLRLAVKALLADARIDQVRVAVAPGDGWVEQALAGLPRTVWRPCGGPDRADTVAAALQEASPQADDWVLVHDAARPGLPPDALARLIDACLEDGVGGLLAQPVADTVKRAGTEANLRPVKQAVASSSPDDDGAEAADRFFVQATVPRDALWLAQTPQMFPAGLLRQSLRDAKAKHAAITDEASAMELAGHHPRLVAGSARNFKVTWPEDFELMEKWL